MIIPTEKLVRFTAIILLPLGAIAAMRPDLAWLLSAAGVILVSIAIIDAAFVAKFPSNILVECAPKIRLTRNVQGNIDLLLRSERPRKDVITLGLNLPLSINTTLHSTTVKTGAGPGLEKIAWPVTATTRGLYLMNPVPARILSPLKLWYRQTSFPCHSEIAVYPNLFKERRHLAAHFLNRANVGSHAQRPIGKGREFEKLRDYVSGDSPTDVHWKASAKRGQLVTKEFMIERTQEIYVMVDASRLSSRSDSVNEGSDPALEKFITSALMLGMVAQRQGDLFGLLTFDNQILRFLKAGGGSTHFRTCRDALYDLQPSPVNPNFGELASFINLNLRKRSLIFLLTSLDDQAMAESFERDLSLVNRRHLVIVNVLKPRHAMPVFSGEPVTDTGDLYKRLAGHMALSDLEELKVKLKHKGMDLYLMGDGSLSTRMVSQYMDVKRRQLL